MNARVSKTLIAGCVAALVSAPGWTEGSGAAAGKTATPQTSERGAQPGTSGSTTQAPTTAAIVAVPIYALTPDQLKDMEVVDAAGKHIGDVDEVVRRDDQLHVVVGAGGFLGINERDVVLPLDQLQVTADNKLQLENATKEALLAQPEYEERLYVELEPGNQPISDFAAFEPNADQPARSPGMDKPSSAPGRDQGAAPKSGDEAAKPSGDR